MPNVAADDRQGTALGLVQVYTGDGKGKTTAALGLAVRAAGHGYRTYIGQFMKGQVYGELRGIDLLAPYVTVEQYGAPTFLRREDVRDRDRAMARAGLQRVREVLTAGRYQIVVLDEILMALLFGLLALDEVLDLIATRPAGVELVLTGRRAPQAIIDVADLVTEMVEVKHPYQQGIPARKGIES
ncbi:MAG TPA: cob(I)yrinic acid a,c-diamide adenosyltransferase [Chloroflexi bacterium]|nr:cob(I)yrinic acid a,c-diamide adenosyltransferase [Chloroflexota bacterium]